MVPKEKRSARGSAGLPSMVSGARWDGDPRMLQVAMNNSRRVRVLQRFRDGEQASRGELRWIEWMLVGERPQGLPADELGDEIARLCVRAREVVDVEDVRVMQARHRVRLAIEALADL